MKVMMRPQTPRNIVSFMLVAGIVPLLFMIIQYSRTLKGMDRRKNILRNPTAPQLSPEKQQLKRALVTRACCPMGGWPAISRAKQNNLLVKCRRSRAGCGSNLSTVCLVWHLRVNLLRSYGRGSRATSGGIGSQDQAASRACRRVRPLQDSRAAWFSLSSATHKNRLRESGTCEIAMHRGTLASCPLFPILR